MHLDLFWQVLRSWSLERQRTLFQYVTGLKRVPATDQVKVLSAPDGEIRRVTILGNVERAVPDSSDDTPEHTLYIPPFETFEAMEGSLLGAITDCSWVSIYLLQTERQSLSVADVTRIRLLQLRYKICPMVQDKRRRHLTRMGHDVHSLLSTQYPTISIIGPTFRRCVYVIVFCNADDR